MRSSAIAVTVEADRNGPLMSIEPDALIATACEQTGLSDFGGDSFREGLAVYCEAASAEAQLSPIGAAGGSRRNSVGADQSPEGRRLDQAASGNLRGAYRGAVRGDRHVSGRHYLPHLSAGKGRASSPALVRWEAGDSVPPPRPETLRSDPRIDATRAAMAMMDQMNPRMRVVQSEEPDGPDRMYLGPQSGFQKPDLGGDGQRADLWRMAARDRSSIGL